MRYYEVHKATPQQTAQDLLAMNHLAVYDACGFYQEGRWGRVIITLNGWEVEIFAYDISTQEVALIQEYRRRNAIVVYIQTQVERCIKHIVNGVSTTTSHRHAGKILPKYQL
ncbi:MAG: hypothetical protein KF716_20105 [Anaerolineae bacterium]|nr:hypothetical protein [Anaerolineae bacterium]